MVIRVETGLTVQMNALRAKHFFNASSCDCSDPFDNCSTHTVAYINNRPIAMARNTPGPASPIQLWSKGKSPLPNGQGVMEATRAVVDKEWRGKGLYRLLIAIIFMQAIKQCEIEKLVAVHEIDFKYRHVLQSMGFVNYGESFVCIHPLSNEAVSLQGIIANTKQTEIGFYEKTYHEIQSRLLKKWNIDMHTEISKLWCER
jgi:GNAT superfamily N-acetyltransferase